MKLPSKDAIAQSQKLIAHVVQLIEKKQGMIPFDEYMQAVLYTPGLGYYQSGTVKLGAVGDFVTAPEISPLFGQCIAIQLQSSLNALEQPVVFELGAGTGKMARDILLKLQELDALPHQYWILEPSATLQAEQKSLLKSALPDYFSHIRWLEQLPDKPFNGVILGNEVLDALPVKRYQIEQGECRELGVGFDGERFEWKEMKCDSPPAVLNTLSPNPFPMNGREALNRYLTEVNVQLPIWLKSITEQLQQGLVLFFDYGYPAREYYQADRSMGTLMCYYQHHKHDDPFVYPGLQDVTAHVDFTAVAEAGVDCGLELIGYTTQALFLAANQIDTLPQQIIANDSDQSLKVQSQLRQLMSPQAMGDLVKVIAFTHNMESMAFDGWMDLRQTL